MARFELTIDPEYIPRWGVWEGVREVIQNALDGQDRDYPMHISHDGKHLVVRNDGLRLDRKVLLLGNTTKRGDDSQRGEWGEGLKLGMLALLRSDVDVFILNGQEKWTPCISFSETFGTELLAVSTRKQVKRDHDFTVFVGISEEQWSQFKSRFLALRDDIDFIGDRYGRILLGKQFKGQVYANGIYVRTYDDLEYGYDFKHLKLDRDRKMAEEWDLRSRMQNAWRDTIVAKAQTDEASASHLACKAYSILSRDGSHDLRGLGSSLEYAYGEDRDIVSRLVAEQFEAEHGQDARPVSAQSEVEKLQHVGLRAVIVPKPLQDVLKHHYGSTEDIYRKATKEHTKSTPIGDLTAGERKRLEQAVRILHLALPGLGVTQLMERIKVVTFIDDTIDGVWTPFSDGSYEVKIARHTLGSVTDILRILIHEFAHNWGGDGTALHGHKVESMWATVVGALLARAGCDWIDAL